MGVAEWAVVASVVFAGVWSGLLATVTMLLHPMLAKADGRGFLLFLREFLPVARTAPINYVAVIGLVVAPAVAIVALLDETGEPAFWLLVVGFAFTVAGPLLVSRFFAEPNYDVLLGWDPERPPAEWEQGRHRYFALNWIRGAATWIAFALFLAALVELL